MNLEAFMTTYNLSLSVFVTNETPSDTKRHCESAEPEAAKPPKIVFHLCAGLFKMVGLLHKMVFA